MQGAAGRLAAVPAQKRWSVMGGAAGIERNKGGCLWKLWQRLSHFSHGGWKDVLSVKRRGVRMYFMDRNRHSI